MVIKTFFFFLCLGILNTLFYLRQCIHSIRYIITYNISLIIFFTYIFFCFQGLLELVQAGIEVKCVIIKQALDIDIIFCI